MTAAIDVRGIATAMVTKKAIYRVMCLYSIERYPAPKLEPDVVAMDSLGSHNLAGVREAFTDFGARARFCSFVHPIQPDRE